MTDDALLTPEDAAAKLSITREGLRALVHTGRLPVVKINQRVWRFRPADIAAFIRRASACPIR